MYVISEVQQQEIVFCILSSHAQLELSCFLYFLHYTFEV